MRNESIDCFGKQLSNYASLEGVLYCKPHFEQLLKLTGSFDKSFEHKATDGSSHDFVL